MAVLNEISLDQVIWVDPERMSGIPCFAGTRVPVQALLDHLESGSTLDDFLEGFPTVTREQAVALLEMAKDQLVRCVFSLDGWNRPEEDVAWAHLQSLR